MRLEPMSPTKPYLKASERERERERKRYIHIHTYTYIYIHIHTYTYIYIYNKFYQPEISESPKHACLLISGEDDDELVSVVLDLLREKAP